MIPGRKLASSTFFSSTRGQIGVYRHAHAYQADLALSTPEHPDVDRAGRHIGCCAALRPSLVFVGVDVGLGVQAGQVEGARRLSGGRERAKNLTNVSSLRLGTRAHPIAHRPCSLVDGAQAWRWPVASLTVTVSGMLMVIGRGE